MKRGLDLVLPLPKCGRNRLAGARLRSGTGEVPQRGFNNVDAKVQHRSQEQPGRGGEAHDELIKPHRFTARRGAFAEIWASHGCSRVCPVWAYRVLVASRVRANRAGRAATAAHRRSAAQVRSRRHRSMGCPSAQTAGLRELLEPFRRSHAVSGARDRGRRFVTVTIWEATSGGLFSAPIVADKIGAGSNSAMIPEQVVGRDGGITVPYGGRIHVAGKTTRAVQATVEKALEGKAIEPPVLISVSRPVSNSVSVGGEVTAGARIPLSVKGDRLLDVLAAAGGVRAPVNETFVELSRGSTTSRMPLLTIIATPRKTSICVRTTS